LEEQLYVFLVTRDSLKIYTPKVLTAELWKRIKAVRAQIVNPESTARGQSAAGAAQRGVRSAGGIEVMDQVSLDDHLTALYDMLIAPIEPEIADKQTVAFIPNQLLYYLPMQALARKQNGKLRYLIEDKQIAYLTAADVMKVVQAPDAQKLHSGLVAFGNPTGANLPHAEQEVKAIAEIFPAARALSGAEVTKSSVMAPQNLNRRVVHFATHGILNPKVPDQSYIQLAHGAGSGVEQLTVGEVWDLPLQKVDLVTLSACETALAGANPSGGEITTLAEAFSTAGATTVIASLWSVADDSTKELMMEFYRQLAAGKSKAASLQAAELKVMKNPKYSHPFYWAPFILMGDWR
jgi:CHAT domain-containing protein